MISRISFATLALMPVSLLAQPAQNLDHEHTELPALSVTADPFAQRNPVEATQPTSVLAGDALEQARGATLGETLAAQAGVHSADFGAGASRPIIRGQAGPRVRILNGGSAIADASTLSPDHNVAVEPFRATQIEILKGPASLMYGSGAIGGVINTVSDLVPSQSVPGPQGGIGFSGNSVNDSRALWGTWKLASTISRFISMASAATAMTMTSPALPIMMEMPSLIVLAGYKTLP